MLEIISHDGPARLGNIKNNESPGILIPGEDFSLIPDEPMPYNVPLKLAEYSVNKTIERCMENDERGIAVVHGSKYLDLRIKCAGELEKLGNPVLLVANSDELLNRPMDLIKIVVGLREELNPNTALYFPFIKLNFLPLLAYMGVDLFGAEAGNLYAHLKTLTTPHKNYPLDEYEIYQFNQQELANYNQKSIDFVLREIRENIRNGTMRNLVEERCCSSPETMTALRILDRDYSGYLDKYTPLY
ncbi:MAG: archaeosine tRNA-ribosyltransferase [Methanobacterium sp.]|nr:archaeosine tRNA-ribosyltransferase [Methanobacterium sp.]